MCYAWILRNYFFLVCYFTKQRCDLNLKIIDLFLHIGEQKCLATPWALVCVFSFGLYWILASAVTRKLAAHICTACSYHTFFVNDYQRFCLHNSRKWLMLSANAGVMNVLLLSPDHSCMYIGFNLRKNILS